MPHDIGGYVFNKRCLFYREAMEEGEIEEEETKKKVPLSLEELLAKKKAEEEALAKVCVRTIYHISPKYFLGTLTFYHTCHNLVLLNPDIPCLCKQCRSRSVGFFRSQLIWICTVCHLICEFVSKS